MSFNSAGRQYQDERKLIPVLLYTSFWIQVLLKI